MTRLVSDLDTPALLVDLDRLERNLAAMAELARTAGLRLRPHAKTHKCLEIGRAQIAHGACGLTVALVEEAECLVRAGVTGDVRVAYPVVAPGKARRLAELARVARVSVFADSREGVAALDEAACNASVRLGILLEVDSGQHRSGLPFDAPLLEELAAQVRDAPGLELRGVGTHGGHVYAARDAAQVAAIGDEESGRTAAAAARLRAAGFEVAEVSVGSTPTASRAAATAGVTEVRPGVYVFHDMTQVALGVVDLERCALAVLATCVSRPAADRAILDAGSKSLGMDRIRGEDGAGYGSLLRLDREPVPGARIERLSEEHGVVRLDPATPVAIGEPVLVVPNHCCAVVNLFDRLHGVRGGRVEERFAVAARGHAT